MMNVSRYKGMGWVLILVSTMICALLAGLLLRLGGREHILHVLSWVEGFGTWGPVMFVGLQTLVVVFLFPGILFTMGAGFLFGPIWGTVCMILGNTIGGALAFLAARTVLKKPVARLLTKRPQLHELDKRLSGHGWKGIMLTRMIPFFPFKLSNYCFGVMGFTLRDMVIGTLIGVIPITLTNVYAGSLAGDLATMDSVGDRGAWTWMIHGAGLVALVVLVVYLARIAQKQLNDEQSP